MRNFVLFLILPLCFGAKNCTLPTNVNLNESYKEVKAIMEAQRQQLIEQRRHEMSILDETEVEPLPHPLNLQENQASK